MSKNNKWANLLTALDDVIGGSDMENSHYKITRQGFDNDRKEFFAQIEYRYRRDTTPQQKDIRRKTQQPARSETATFQQRKRQNFDLLKSINVLAKTGGATVPIT